MATTVPTTVPTTSPFVLGYYNDDDPDRKIKSLDSTFPNWPSAKGAARGLGKHPSFNNKTVVVIDRSHPITKVYLP